MIVHKKIYFSALSILWGLSLVFLAGQASASVSLNACTDITTSGIYTLTGDLSGQNNCIFIHDVDSVTLDCQNHKISATQGAVAVGNVHNFNLLNCNLVSPSQVPLHIYDAANGVIQGNSFSSSRVIIERSTSINFSNNKSSADYNFIYSRNNKVDSDSFVGGTPGSIYGGSNIFSNNTIDGTSDGVLAHANGTDDGIVIWDESGDQVLNNKIKNNFDCGIEGIGVVSNTVIRGNSVTNTGNCVIGAWYWSSWQGNTIDSNYGDQVPAMFVFRRNNGLRPAMFDSSKKQPADSAAYFANNTFTNNVLTNAKLGVLGQTSIFDFSSAPAAGGAFAPVPGEIAIQPSQMILQSNTFSGNNFGTSLPAPFFSPTAMIVDGGTNVCSRGTDSTSPLTCARPTPTPTPTPTPVITAIPTPVRTSTPTPSVTLTPVITPIVTTSHLLKSAVTSKVYYITNGGLKRWIPNLAVFNSYGDRWQDVVTVPQSQLDVISDNILIKSSASVRIYKLENGKKRWISTYNAFVRNSFSMSQVAPVNKTEFDYYLNGATIN